MVKLKEKISVSLTLKREQIIFSYERFYFYNEKNGKNIIKSIVKFIFDPEYLSFKK